MWQSCQEALSGGDDDETSDYEFLSTTPYDEFGVWTIRIPNYCTQFVEILQIIRMWTTVLPE